MSEMKEKGNGLKSIPISEIKGFRIGQAEDVEGATGVTLIVAPEGATAGVDVRGGGPATRETDLLRPENMVQQIHAVVLSGGSAFGLEAASGVMNVLEAAGIGFDTGVGVVPIVCGASLFDLQMGEPGIRPNREMGEAAAQLVLQGEVSASCDPAASFHASAYQDGNHGAGTGATVGKYRGLDRLMKSGQGAAAVEIGALQIGAISCVNALGDVFDAGTQIAGLRSEDGTRLSSTAEEMLADAGRAYNVFTGNTTISCVLTNAKLTKAQCCKIASIAHDGYARAIRPVHSSADGDTVFVLSTGEVEANFDTVGLLAADLIEEAIVTGVKAAEAAYGAPAARDFLGK